jgi:integration host factor subunit alpha
VSKDITNILNNKGEVTMPLTKRDLIDDLYTELGIPKKKCVSIIDSIFEIMKDDLACGNDVKISGFGKWSVKSKRARRGRNPQTGEDMLIDARKVITFRGSYILRTELDGKQKKRRGDVKDGA